MTKALSQYLQQQLSSKFQKEITVNSYQQVYGGDINQTFVADTGDEKLFIKINEASLPGLFQKEYSGLSLLKNKSITKIPEPILYGEFENIQFLVMEYLEKTEPDSRTWKALGEGLASLHKQTADKFGLEYDNYLGSLPQRNLLTETWPKFYTEQRVMPLIQAALQHNYCTLNDAKDAEKICTKFNHLFPEENPALLHGDLWSGNVMACVNGAVAIYDPAVYYGNREMDIAVTLLFGGFDKSFYNNYNEAYPLQKGWQSRMDLCQLYPLLLHLNLFGKSYYGRVKNILNKYK